MPVVCTLNCMVSIGPWPCARMAYKHARENPKNRAHPQSQARSTRKKVNSIMLTFKKINLINLLKLAELKPSLSLDRHSLPGSLNNSAALTAKLHSELGVKSSHLNLSLGSVSSMAGSSLHGSLGHHMHLAASSSAQQNRHSSSSSSSNALHSGNNGSSSNANSHNSSNQSSSTAGTNSSSANALNSNLYSPNLSSASTAQNNSSAFGSHSASKYEHLLSSSANSSANSTGLSNGTPSPNYHHSASAAMQLHHHHHHHHQHHAAAAMQAAHHAMSHQGLSQHNASGNGNNSQNSSTGTNISNSSAGGYGVKSELNANSTNYDYVNNCYFGASFGALGAASATAGGIHGSATELAGYHHQHNVIQAAKLMATS